MAEPDVALLTAAIPPPELDPEDSDTEETAIVRYEFLELVAAIGRDDFKEVYMNMIDDIKAQSVQNQIELCVTILGKIRDHYEFELPIHADIENQQGINEVYQLISFLEFDYLEFFAGLWNGLGVDLKKITIRSFCQNNDDSVINQVEIQLQTLKFSKLVDSFLRTYNKEKMIDFIIDRTEKSKMMIYLTIAEKSL